MASLEVDGIIVDMLLIWISVGVLCQKEINRDGLSCSEEDCVNMMSWRVKIIHGSIKQRMGITCRDTKQRQ